MRFNDRTCVDFLKDGINCSIEFVQGDWTLGRKIGFEQELKETFSKHIHLFSSRVQYITEPFYKAYLSASAKIDEILKTQPLGFMSGTFIVHSDQPGVVKTAFYAIDNPSLKEFNFVYFEFVRSKDHDKTTCGAAIQFASRDEVVSYYISDAYRIRKNAGVDDLIVSFINLCGFLKYCEIDTKIIEPKEKYRDARKTRYFNETKSNIEILDSRWFMDIIRSEGFSVGAETGGFWRLQRVGEGRMKERLTWIWPFEKKGYKMKAKKHEQ